MVGVKVTANTQIVRQIINNLEKATSRIRHDLYKLGDATYNQVLRKVIPVSKLSHPHLRDSFKIEVTQPTRTSLLLSIWSNVYYAPFVDTGATVPTRYPKSKKAMKFTSKTGDVVFTKRAKGFSWRGANYIDKAESFMLKNIYNYVDMTLSRYI